MVTPGQPLKLRIRLSAYRAPGRVVNVALSVPAGTIDGGSLTVTGAYGQYPSQPAVSTFPELLAVLRDAPRNNFLDVTLQLTAPDGTRTVYTDRALSEVVTGTRSYPVAAG